MKGVVGILPLVVALIIVGTGAAPAPKPTAVIAGLGVQTDVDGRYYSVYSPYSIKSAWHGAGFQDTNGQGDRFTSGQRHIDILSFENTKHYNTPSLVEAAQSALQQSGFKPTASTVIHIKSERVPVLVFSNKDGAYAELVFVLANRAWVMALISDKSNARHDLDEFLRAVTTFRLEHTSVK